MKYIFAEDDIKNIAISGAYSSGQSSVIESYKKEKPEKKFLHLSVAHFQALGEKPIDEGGLGSNHYKVNQDESENIIKGKMLNQLIQQIPAERIPQTYFWIKRCMDCKILIVTSTILCVFIALFLHCTRFDA